MVRHGAREPPGCGPSAVCGVVERETRLELKTICLPQYPLLGTPLRTWRSGGNHPSYLLLEPGHRTRCYACAFWQIGALAAGGDARRGWAGLMLRHLRQPLRSLAFMRFGADPPALFRPAPTCASPTEVSCPSTA